MMVSELARRMYLHPATVVGIFTRLESHGLIKRTRSKEDRRVVWVELTLKGKNLVAAARKWLRVYWSWGWKKHS